MWHPMMWWDTHIGVSITTQEMGNNSNNNYVHGLAHTVAPYAVNTH